jgi:hypothetical protein
MAVGRNRCLDEHGGRIIPCRFVSPGKNLSGSTTDFILQVRGRHPRDRPGGKGKQPSCSADFPNRAREPPAIRARAAAFICGSELADACYLRSRPRHSPWQRRGPAYPYNVVALHAFAIVVHRGDHLLRTRRDRVCQLAVQFERTRKGPCFGAAVACVQGRHVPRPKSQSAATKYRKCGKVGFMFFCSLSAEGADLNTRRDFPTRDSKRIGFKPRLLVLSNSSRVSLLALSAII